MNFNITVGYPQEDLTNPEIKEVDLLIELLMNHEVQTLEEMSNDTDECKAWAQVLTALQWERRRLKGYQLEKIVKDLMQDTN